MKILLWLMPFIFIQCVSSASSSNSMTNEPVVADMDSSVYFILPYDSTKWYYKDKKACVLSPEELQQVDTLLSNCIESYNQLAEKKYLEAVKKYHNYELNKYNFVIDLKQYKRQYLPYLDSNGNKVVHVNCFCVEAPNGLKSRWKSSYIVVSDGGNCFFNLTINLTEMKCEDLMVNGDA